MVRGATVRDREYLQDLCGKLPRSGSSAPHPGGSPDDCQRYFGGGLTTRLVDAVTTKENIYDERSFVQSLPARFELHAITGSPLSAAGSPQKPAAFHGRCVPFCTVHGDAD